MQPDKEAFEIVLYEKIVDALHQVSPILAKHEISRDSLLIADMRIDSLKVAELSILLEQAFDRHIFLPELLACGNDPQQLTVAELIAFVRERL